MQHQDIFALMEGKIRPTEATGDAGTDGKDTEVIFPAPLFTSGLADSSGGTLQQPQATF